jgi:subtilisin-like proprotein convertase family protein
LKLLTCAIASLNARNVRIGIGLSAAVALTLLAVDPRTAAAPSPFAPDALLEQQWHLKDRRQETGGANVRAAWNSSLGAGVVIGIVDDGVSYAHPDLSPNYLASASWDFNFNDADASPYSTSGHGTSIAGLAAARGDNSIGVSGAAPQASFASLRLTANVATDAMEAAAFNFQPSVIHILNNSWNPADNGTTLKGPGSQAAAARQSAITNGRSGKGRIFVWSSGNGRLSGDDCNFDGYANHRFAIAVGAATDAAVQMPQSEGCSALMVLAPGGGGTNGLTTTDLLSTPGYDSGDYTDNFGTSTTGGMSAAAPTVSGAVALMLARNPNLTWRDVQHILRQTSVRILPTDAGWTTGAFPHNERLGFGLLDADAAVDLAAQWANVPAEEALSATRNLNKPIPDINNTGVSDTITISSNESNFVIEHIEVETNITHTWRGDLQVKLTSPAGVVSTLAPIRPSDSGDNLTAWKFGSVRHWGESAAGAWTLNVSDRRFQDTGTLNNWTLRIYGYRGTASVPGAFSKSSPANGATGISTSPTLSWGASTGATNYEYCYDATNDNACSGWTSAGTNTSAAIGGLANGTSYYWHVRATNAQGTTYAQGSTGAFWAFSTSAAAPPGAFNLSSPANGATGQSLNPTLTWTASSGAVNYEYCYDTTNNGGCTGWISLGGVGTSVALGGLAPGTQYWWLVRALNAAGAATYAGGSSSGFWSFATGALPGAFAKSSPASGATGQSLTPTIDWGSSSGATGYAYCYDTTNDSACSNWIGAGTNTSAMLSGLSPGVTYYWQARASNGAGTVYANGAATSFWSFTTIPAPGAFGRIGPANGSTGQSLNPTLTWSASAGAANYDYCYDTSNDGACGNWLGAGASTSVGLSGLTSGVTYYWHVRAVNGGGTTYANGAATAFWSFTTGTLPGAFAKSSPATGATGQSLTPTIDWGSSSGAASYEYCYDTTNNSACTNWTSVGANSTAMLSGLSPGTTYYWQARANNAAGSTYANGAETSFWSFTTTALPGAFGHSSPANASTGQSLNPTLNWTASAGVANYDYCYDTTDDNACANWLGAGASTSVGLSGLAASTTYYWHVRAVNGGGTTYANGAATAFWSFTTGSLPGAFAKTSPANGATGLSLTPSLDWSASSGATSYEYCYDTTNDNACSNWTSAGAVSSGELSGLTPATTYYWQARATNGAGTIYANGAATSFWSFTTIAQPGAFAHSSPANGAINQSVTPTLSWTASAGVANYDYCYDTTNDNACSNWIGAGASTSVPLSGLAANTMYYWQVRAVNGGGTTYANGAATAFWSFKTRLRSEIVDLDGDGDGDAFTYNPSTGAWARQVSNGNGAFSTTTGSWNPGWTVSPATFNADALTDFFLFNPQSGQWFKMLNTGTGFSAQSSGSWWQGWERYVMDLDGDGVSDLFLYDRSSGQWFKAISTANGFNYLQGGWNANWEIYPVTLNGDAREDMFLINRTTGRWFWVLGEAGSGFSYPASETWFPGWQLYPGDFSGDGITDILLHDPTTGMFFVATANAAGFTYQQGGWSLGWTPGVADFNGDGRDDLFLHAPLTGLWFEMLSNGAGGFTNAGGQGWSLGWQLHFTDLNSDGRADMVLYDPSSGAWYQARNFTLGSFSYTNGTWTAGLTVITRPPIR